MIQVICVTIILNINISYKRTPHPTVELGLYDLCTTLITIYI